MYKNYSDEELIEAYTSMIEYSGKPNKDMLAAIEERGGLKNFLKSLETKKAIEEETEKLKKEIFAHCRSGSDPSFMKKTIDSEILSRQQLEQLIDTKFIEYKKILENRAITSRTIVGSMGGIIIGIVLGGGLLVYVGPLLKISLLFYFPILYLIHYFFIRLFTKQSRANTIVFIASFIGALATYFVASFFDRLVI